MSKLDPGALVAGFDQNTGKNERFNQWLPCDKQ